MEQLNIKNNIIFIIKMFSNKPSLFFILGLLMILNIFLYFLKNIKIKKITEFSILILLLVILNINIDFISLVIKNILYPKPYIILTSFILLVIFNIIDKYKVQKILLIIFNTLYLFSILLFFIYFFKSYKNISYNYLFYKNTKILNLLVFSNLCVLSYIFISIFIRIFYKIIYGKKYIYDKTKFIEKL